MLRTTSGMVAVLALSACGSACGSGDPPTDGVRGERCVVRLHGKGDDGQPSRRLEGGIVEISPAGNAEAWGGREWRYFPDERYREALAAVTSAIDESGCETVVVDGFSNGASFAAAMYCRGETLDARLAGVVIDDPVPDAATDGCAPDTRVDAVLYWTGALVEEAPVGSDCAGLDWTCAGGAIVGIDRFAAAAGLDVTASPLTGHAWYRDAPAISRWLTG